MRHNSSFRRGQKRDEERKKLLKVAVIPLAVVILILVIVIADRDKDSGENAAAEPAMVSETLLEPGTNPSDDDMAAEEAGEQESDAGAESEVSDPVEESTEAAAPEEVREPLLQKDSVPELLSMMKKYYQARATGDAELLNKLYGIEGLSVAALEAEKTRMRSNSKYLRGFENIVTYIADGLNENEWLVYSTCDIKFHSVETAAPMIMWCYVTEQEDGSLLIRKPEELSPEVLHHVDVVSRSQEVRSLASDINVRLKDALLADANLNEVYGVLRDGSPVYQNSESEETGAVQILDEESEADADETVNTDEIVAGTEAVSTDESAADTGQVEENGIAAETETESETAEESET